MNETIFVLAMLSFMELLSTEKMKYTFYLWILYGVYKVFIAILQS